MKTFLAFATRVRNPIALGGLIIGVFFLIVRLVISAGLIPQVTAQTGGTILLRIINGFIILSLVAVVLGFAGFVIGKRYPKLDPNYVNVTSDQERSLSQLITVIATKRNVTINFHPDCDETIRRARVEPGKYEGRDMKHLLESFKQRVKGKSISYAVRKEGERRYEIVCK